MAGSETAHPSYHTAIIGSQVTVVGGAQMPSIANPVRGGEFDPSHWSLAHLQSLESVAHDGAISQPPSRLDD